jgi:hypothetical protein
VSIVCLFFLALSSLEKRVVRCKERGLRCAVGSQVCYVLLPLVQEKSVCRVQFGARAILGGGSSWRVWSRNIGACWKMAVQCDEVGTSITSGSGLMSQGVAKVCVGEQQDWLQCKSHGKCGSELVVVNIRQPT